MFNIGQIVRYGTHGICRIEDKETKQFGKDRIDYYVLRPVSQDGSTIYVPVGNEKLVSRMQKLLSAEEIDSIIGCMGDEDEMWISEDVKRRDAYNEILRSGDRAAMARIIKTLYLRRKDLEQKRKKLHIADEKILKEAERVLYEEFAYVLGIDANQVVPYIHKQLEKNGSAS